MKNVVKGLNNAGFSRKDYLVGSDVVPPAPVPEVGQQTTLDTVDTVPVAVDDDFSDIDTSAIDVTIPDTGDTAPAPDISAMLSAASKQAQEYKQESDESDKWGFVGGELGEMKKQFPVQEQFREQIKDIRLPQFCLKTQPDFFNQDGLVPLEKENLLGGSLVTHLRIDRVVKIEQSLAVVPVHKLHIRLIVRAYAVYLRIIARELISVNLEFLQPVLEHINLEAVQIAARSS